VKVEIVYYDPRSRRVMSKVMVEMNGLEDWRVQAMVHKLLREGKRIRDVKVQKEEEEEKTPS
jgi:hypothetical protein